jgi:rod shape determining protein RodA
MNRRVNILESIDWLSIILYVLLVAFGWMNIYAVNCVEADGFVFSVQNRYTMQLVWIMVSVVLAIIIFLIDSRFYSFIAYPAYIFSIFLLLIVLIIGKEVNGAKSWFTIGPIKIQPSEFAKLATILVIAKYLSGYNIKTNSLKNILISLLFVVGPLGLIMLQPDFGSTLVYGAMLIILYREGLPGWILLLVLIMAGIFIGYFVLSDLVLLIILALLAYVAFYIINKSFKNFIFALLILGVFQGIFFGLKYLGVLSFSNYLFFFGGLVAAVAVSLIIAISNKIKGAFVVVLFLFTFIGSIYSIDFVFENVMQPHHRDRVYVMLGQKSDPWGYEYNVNQSKIAIGSGGFSGRGFLQGPQTKLKYVPEQSTDFIFCTVGEEWGFVGSVAFIAVFIGLLIRLIIVSERQRSRFSRIFGYGVVTILFFHFAVNIAMTLAIFPVIGIPLPFMSYGGSSLMSFTMMVFILLRLDSTRKSYLI